MSARSTGTSPTGARAYALAGLSSYGHIQRTADGTQSISTGGAAATVLWQTSLVAARGGITYSAGVFTIGTAGTYVVTCYIGIAASATGRRQCIGRHNGTTRGALVTPAPSAGQWLASVSFCVDAAAGDTIDFTVFQDSGGALNLTSGHIAIHRVA